MNQWYERLFRPHLSANRRGVGGIIHGIVSLVLVSLVLVAEAVEQVEYLPLIERQVDHEGIPQDAKFGGIVA